MLYYNDKSNTQNLTQQRKTVHAHWIRSQNADEGQDLIAAHDDPLVHYFNVPKKSVWDDDAIAAEAASSWERVRPGYARDMSAVAYFFARKLARTIDCPIGIIDCYWGGTSVTCWMDKEALEATAEGQR